MVTNAILVQLQTGDFSLLIEVLWLQVMLELVLGKGDRVETNFFTAVFPLGNRQM